jgi:hypothetical protein
MKKKYLLSGLIFGLIFLSVAIFFLINGRGEKKVTDDINNKPTTNYGFILEKKYKSDNLWEYKVTGQFPNPCFTASVEEIVRESYPEQVTILVSISQPPDDMVCAQVISDFVYEGTFSASEKALIKLEVKD